MKQAWAPLSAGACIPVAALIAWLLDADVAFAAVGASLGLVYSLLELVTLLVAAKGSLNRSIALGVGGMMARLFVMLGALTLIGLWTGREQMLAVVLGFLAAFTVSFAVRTISTAHHLGQPRKGVTPGRTVATGSLGVQRSGRSAGARRS